MINVFQPALGNEELEAVRQVFASNWPGKGPFTDRFETAFAAHIDSDRRLVRSVTSCTEGLFLALRLLDVGPGDEVILPTISFVGAANAIVDRGARPVFCDVDAASLNAVADTIAPCISSRTRAILLLHYGGVPCDMDAIVALTRHHGLSLVEDNACSVSSSYRDTPCGLFGDVSVWSFDSMKALVTGDGGMIRCRTREWADLAERLLYLGLEQQSGLQKEAETRWWEFDVACSGRRAILNDIAAAIGLEQLKKLPAFIRRRREVHERYDTAFASVDWLRRPPPVPADRTSSYYMYWIQVPGGGRRDRLATHLRQRDIYTTFRYHPLHRVAFYGASSRLPNAEQAADETLCLPLHQSLSNADLDCVVDAVRCFEAGA